MVGEEQRIHPLQKLLGGEKPYLKTGCEPLEERQKFLYVFGQEQRVLIQGYTVKVLAFAGVSARGVVSVLPLFLYAEACEGAPWTDILGDLSKYCEYEFLILAEYSNAIANAAQALQLNIKHLAIVYYAPENAVKYVLETVYKEFEAVFKKFWSKCGAIVVSEFSQIETIAKTCIKELTEHFDGKSFLKETAGQISVQAVLDAIKPEAASAANSDASRPIPSGAASYCIAFEKNCFETGSRRRIVVFFAVCEGAVRKAVVAVLPDQADNAVWEEAIKKASDAAGRIDYLLFCGCSVNLWAINKGILPKTVWCSSIADFDTTEAYCEKTKQTRNYLEYEVMSKFSGSASQIKAYLSQSGIADVTLI